MQEGEESTPSQSALQRHLATVKEIRNNAMAVSTKASKRMVEKNSAKFPPAEYQINSEVIVRRHSSRSRKNSGKEIVGKQSRIVRGTVIERNLKTGTYKIHYNLNNNPVEQWFQASDITSLTLEEENQKHNNMDNKKEGSQNLGKCGYNSCKMSTLSFPSELEGVDTTTGSETASAENIPNEFEDCSILSSSTTALTCTKGNVTY